MRCITLKLYTRIYIVCVEYWPYLGYPSQYRVYQSGSVGQIEYLTAGLHNIEILHSFPSDSIYMYHTNKQEREGEEEPLMMVCWFILDIQIDLLFCLDIKIYDRRNISISIESYSLEGINSSYRLFPFSSDIGNINQLELKSFIPGIASIIIIILKSTIVGEME